MNKLKFIFLLLITGVATAKEIKLEDCQTAAQMSSPLNKQLMLQESKYIFEERSLSANYLPQISIEGQATYQSDVVKLVLPLPGIKMPEIPLEQYKVNLNINQMLWDGGATSANKDIRSGESRLNQSLTNVNLYTIKDIVNQLYFNILLTKENIGTLEITKSLLDTNKKIIESLVRNGVLLRSNLESIEIELLKIEQNTEQLKSNLNSLIAVLSKWTGLTLSESDEFLLPGINQNDNKKLNRPEFQMFDERDKMTSLSSNLLETQMLPKVYAFGQGGYGNPNPFNFFDTKGSFYYIVGLKFQWSPFDWNSNWNKRQSLDINKDITSTERENFSKALDINLTKEETELQRYDRLLELDTEIIERQQIINQEYFSRLKNNTITVNDYLSQVNSLLVAKINRDVHKIQQLRTRINLLTISGNL